MTPSRLSPLTIRLAYEQGAFPMGDSAGRIDWYQPHLRALFPIQGLHVSRSLAKTLRSAKFEVRFDSAFEDVMRNCIRPTDNWITEELIQVYTTIFFEGWGHCAECWHDGRLVGGVYGIAIGGCFCAESMFHRETDASKVALKSLIDRCRELGFSLFDAQIQNPHLASLGSYEIQHREYIAKLRSIINVKTEWSGIFC
jgi:leucyl/phenylalanyl-tRNA--protein transferase